MPSIGGRYKSKKRKWLFTNKKNTKKGYQILYSESESIERYNRGLTERFWRGNEKGLFDLGLLVLSDLPLSFIPRSKEAAEGTKVRPKNVLKHCQ